MIQVQIVGGRSSELQLLTTKQQNACFSASKIDVPSGFYFEDPAAQTINNLPADASV